MSRSAETDHHDDAHPDVPSRRKQAGGTNLLDDELKGHERLRLIADLAMNELSHRELAHREGVTQADVKEFATAHVGEIAEVRAALAGQLAIESAGLWISKKQNRLAEYQNEAEEIRDFLADMRHQGIRWSRSHRDMLKLYFDIFKQAADELGAYPQRAQAPARTGQTVHYVIDTENPGALQ
jgi:predicted transcriptional regulator